MILTRRSIDRCPGNLLQKQGQVEEAHYYYKKVLAINPLHPESLYNQASAYQLQVTSLIESEVTLIKKKEGTHLCVDRWHGVGSSDRGCRQLLQSGPTQSDPHGSPLQPRGRAPGAGDLG